jgi:hypothetical protein
VQPTQSPLGLAPTDLLEFAVLALLVAGFVIWTPRVQHWFANFARRTKLCMLILFLLPIALRLLLLPSHPTPTPDIYDEFSHLLVADTLLHLRLANPPHALHQFFETFFVLQQPTYSSIYSLGQGIILAIGRVISGAPWAGVLICVGFLSSLCYWMLRAWITPAWALAGGLLAVIEFGPLNQWTNSYWGGALPGCAGCLVFGALPRLATAWRKRDAALLGLGAAIHCITRQFESTLLLLCIILFVVPKLRDRNVTFHFAKLAPYALAAAIPLFALILLQNKAVTHHWLELPEQLSQYQYGVPTSLTFQRVPVPHVPLTPEQALDYKAQTLTHGPGPETLSRFLLRMEFRVRYYRFFFLPALYISLFAFLFTLREKRSIYVGSALAVFALGTNLFPYLLTHYLAAVTCMFILAAMIGLEHINRFCIRDFAAGAHAVKIIALVCIAHFAAYYGSHLFERSSASQNLESFETWDVINHGDPHGRLAVARQLSAIPGRLVVLVRYSPHHIFQNEWVWNAADIDAQRVVWARDLGDDENSQLLSYFANRNVYLLQPDSEPPRLQRYTPAQKRAPSPFEEVH